MKAEKLVLGLRWIKTPVTPVNIQEISMDIVEDNKYLGVFGNVDNMMMRVFFECVMTSAIVYAVSAGAAA